VKKINDLFSKFLNVIIALALGLMAILVFGNVVLRYVFNSGITWSEEMARFLFIWSTFLGAIAGLNDNEHLGVDMFLKKFPRTMKKIAFILSNLLMLTCLWLILDGSWKMTWLNRNSLSPALELPLSFIYGIGILLSVGMGFIIITKLYQILFKQLDDDELILTKDSEELIGLDQSKQE
jgi:TRAP-type C4-dicarboxylate transport system permease small subunit